MLGMKINLEMSQQEIEWWWETDCIWGQLPDNPILDLGFMISSFSFLFKKFRFQFRDLVLAFDCFDSTLGFQFLLKLQFWISI